jgi:hypothetical protein
MHLQTFRDESRSRHLDLIRGRGYPWSIDLVAVIASAILLMTGYKALPITPRNTGATWRFVLRSRLLAAISSGLTAPVAQNHQSDSNFRNRTKSI